LILKQTQPERTSMPPDAAAATKFANDPLAFLQKNYFYVRGQQTLNPTRKGKGGIAWKNKYLGGVKNTYALNDPKVNITNQDLVTVTAAGQQPPTAYVGFEAQTEKHKWEARVQADQEAARTKVYFLNASANQICVIKLPTQGGPNVVLTDPLTGCSVFVAKDGNTTLFCHANALALTEGEALDYMENLYQGFTDGTDIQLVAKLTKETYEQAKVAIETKGRADKHKLGRTQIDTQVEQMTNVVGIRKNQNWKFYYQVALTLDSVRTGFTGVVKDIFKWSLKSHKFRIAVEEIPAV
jgi:hypothetical protein